MPAIEFGAGVPEEFVIEPNRPVYTFEPPRSDIVVLPVPGPPGPPGSLDDLTTVQNMIDTSVTTHINSPAPHPAYDDIQDLTLVFENGLV